MSISIEPAGPRTNQRLTRLSTEPGSEDGHYRIAAFPAAYALTDDVMLRDETGRAYILSHEDERPTSIDDETADSLGMFFEPSLDYSWHTVSELRRIIYGVEDAVVAIH